MKGYELVNRRSYLVKREANEPNGAELAQQTQPTEQTQQIEQTTPTLPSPLEGEERGGGGSFPFLSPGRKWFS